jgi:3-oxoadipate enol-lactonase
MAFASIDGIKIYYEEHGSGFPLVLAYGLGGNTRMWAGQREAFAKRCRLVLWDPRGHGGSDSPRERNQYGFDASVRDLLGLLDHLGIEKGYIGGHSMGAGIAAQFALAHPSRTEALILADSASASGLPMSTSMRAIRVRTIELAETQGMAAVADYAIQSNPNLKSQAEASAVARERLRRMFLDLDPIGYAHTIRSLLDEAFPTEKLSQLRVPTLLVVGEQDPALEAMRLTHRMISGSSLSVIPSAGHLANLDQAEEFNAAVLAFFDRLAA